MILFEDEVWNTVLFFWFVDQKLKTKHQISGEVFAALSFLKCCLFSKWNNIKNFGQHLVFILWFLINSLSNESNISIV